MKYLLILIFSLVVIHHESLSQGKNKREEMIKAIENYDVKPLIYTLVDTVEHLSKDEIFQIAKEWAAYNFNNSNYVVKMEDREHGKIIIKAKAETINARNLLQKTHPREGLLSFDMTIECKDERYRMILDRLEHEDPLEGTIQNNRKRDNLAFGPIYDNPEPPPPFVIPKLGSKKERIYYWESLREDVDKIANDFFSSIKTAMRNKQATNRDDW